MSNLKTKQSSSEVPFVVPQRGATASLGLETTEISYLGSTTATRLGFPPPGPPRRSSLSGEDFAFRQDQRGQNCETQLQTAAFSEGPEKMAAAAMWRVLGGRALSSGTFTY